MTEVRLFAALRDAAGGAGRVRSDAPTLAALLSELRETYGEPFASRLAIATVVVDGEPVDPTEERDLTSVRDVALLPPFSGG